jgi:uracil-DNA glycosylase family 4
MLSLNKDEGSRSARFVLVIDAWGHWEQTYGRPMVGPAYSDKLQPWWKAAGLNRSDFYITSCWDLGQPQNINSIPEAEMRAAMDRLHERLAQLEDPYVIVPLGNGMTNYSYALYALTGNGRVSFHNKDGKYDRPGTKEWRGSILSYQDRRGRQIKVISSVHPNSTFYGDISLEWALQMDWQRIAADGQFRELRLPERTKIIAPSAAEAIEWMRWARAEAEKRKDGEIFTERLACSLDVETPYKVEYETRQKESTAANGKCRTCNHNIRWHDLEVLRKDNEIMPSSCKGLRGKARCACTGYLPQLSKPRRVKVSEEAYLGCIGYSWDAKLALCIPTAIEYWQDEIAWRRVKNEIAAFHADPNVDFGGQNFTFDAWWCATEQMPLDHLAWDLMKMHREQRPWSEWNDLAFQASLDTRQPFWKHEAKSPEEISRWSHNKESLWAYNCVDNCVQRELLDVRVSALRSAGRYEYYLEMEAPIDTGLVELSRVGIRGDEQGRAAHYEKVTAEAKEISAALNSAAEMAIVGVSKKGEIIGKVPSPAKLKTFLYEKLRLPLQYRKNQKKQKVVSTDVVTVKRLMENFPGNELLQTVGKLVLRHRRLNTEAQFVKAERLTNGRQVCMFKQETALGRLKAFKTPKGEGANLQQVDRKLRKYYLPDTGDEDAV